MFHSYVKRPNGKMHWEFRCVSWAILWQTYRSPRLERPWGGSPRFLHALEAPWAKQKMRKPMVSLGKWSKKMMKHCYDGCYLHLRGGVFSTFPPFLPYENSPRKLLLQDSGGDGQVVWEFLIPGGSWQRLWWTDVSGFIPQVVEFPIEKKVPNHRLSSGMSF